MFRTFTVSVPIVATATVAVSAANKDTAIELACHILSINDPVVVTPHLNIPILLDFEPDRDGAFAMSEEERTR